MNNIILQVGTKALLYNTSRQFLLIKCSAKYLHLANQWDIPGGRIKPGTDLLTNLSREIKEETNLTLAYEPILIAAQDIIPNNNQHVVRLTYLTRAKGEISLQAEEATEYQWCDWSKVTKLNNLDPYIKEIFNNMPQPLHHLLQSQYAQR